MKRIGLFLGAIFCLFSAQGAERLIYVVPSGGATTVPRGATRVTTLQAGIDQAGRWTKQGDDVRILVAGGDYTLSKTLELTARELGSESGSLVISPVEGERVVLRGGVDLPLSLMKPVPADEPRVREEVRTKLYKIDLNAAGVKQLGELRNSGFGRSSAPAWTEVFINDRAQRISRWPNDTMARMGEVLEVGSVPREGDFANRGGTFRYSEDRPSAWKHSQPRWVAGYFAWGYADEMLPIASIDTVQKTITTAAAAMYGFKSDNDFNRFQVVNLLEEVDLPGEYYIDYDRRELWIYPEEEVRTLSVSLLAEPMMAIEGVKNVTVEGIEFTCSRGMGISMERTEGVVIRGCRFTNLGLVAVMMGQGAAPLRYLGDLMVPKAASRTIGAMNQLHYANVAWNQQGGSNNGIVDCVISDMGCGGVILTGGDRAMCIPAGNYIENCRISNYNRVEKAGRPGISLAGVGNRISHCEILDAPASAIMFSGDEHLIEYCDIHDVCREIDDLGAVYYGRDQSAQGNRLMYNYVHDLNPARFVTGFYHDDGACGTYAYGNIFYRAGLFPVLIGGGSDNRYENNLFIDTKYGIYIDDRLENWCGTPYIDSLYRARFEAVNYKNGPYAQKYPVAANYLEEGYQTPKRNVACRNLFYNIDDLIRQGSRDYEDGHIEMYNNWVTMMRRGFSKPGFVDESSANWNLPADALLFERIQGFEPLPFDRMGCTLPR